MAIIKKAPPSTSQNLALQNMLSTAVAHHEAGELAQAAALYEKLLQYIPDNPEINYLYGSVLITRKDDGDIERSLKHLEDAAQALDTNASVALAFCESLMLNEYYGQAQAALLRAESLGAPGETCGKLALHITRGMLKSTLQQRYSEDKSHIEPQFHLTFPDIKTETQFYAQLNICFDLAKLNRGLFVGDNLITFNKNLSFLDDADLMNSFHEHTETDTEKSTLWRIAVLLWAARQGMMVEGDFVECGCYRGISARILCDVLDFKHHLDRQYYLYDLFEHGEEITSHHAMPAHSSTLVDEVRQRFIDYPNARIIQGCVPDSLHGNMPEKIAFLHIDLNNSVAELGALEVLFERLSPGGILILDDYGWLVYHQQRALEEPWLRKHGYYVLELPTGQGMVIKH